MLKNDAMRKRVKEHITWFIGFTKIYYRIIKDNALGSHVFEEYG